MTSTKIADIALIPAAEDPVITDPRLLASIECFEQTVGSAAQRREPICFSSNASQVAHWAGEYLVVVTPIASALVAALGTWFASKAGRKAKLRVGDIEAEASNIAQVIDLIERGFELQRMREEASRSESDA